MSSQVLYFWCLDNSYALNCVSGYVNCPLTPLCVDRWPQLAAIQGWSQTLSVVGLVLQRRPMVFGFSSLFIWSLYSILAGAHLLGILADSVKCVVRHHGASNLRYFNVQWTEHFCVSELKLHKSLSQTSINACLIWQQHLKMKEHHHFMRR